jgi:hypothetical protein
MKPYGLLSVKSKLLMNNHISFGINHCDASPGGAIPAQKNFTIAFGPYRHGINVNFPKMKITKRKPGHCARRCGKKSIAYYTGARQ